MPDTPPSLPEWLRQQLDEDERIAEGAIRTWCADWTPAGLQSLFDARVDAHIAEHDPARVLRDVAADRQLVEHYETALVARDAAVGTPLAGATRMQLRLTERVLRVRAAAHSSRPGYRQEWAP